MNKTIFLYILIGWLFFSSSYTIPQTRQEVQKESPAYSRVEIKDTELRTIESKYVAQEYKINIFFPKDYEEEGKRYPVVYVLDAEYNFGCVAYIARRLIKNEDIPKILLVGIAYDADYEDFYEKRFRDSTPVSRIHGRNSGGAEQFTQFLEKELIPFINMNYRTIPEDRTLVGHSITGFYCFYALFQHTDLFNRYIVVSPSLWFSNGVVFEYEETFSSNHGDMSGFVYLSVGGEESQQMREGSTKLKDTLLKRAYPHLNFKFSLVEGENHRSLFPYAFSRGLRFIFSDE